MNARNARRLKKKMEISLKSFVEEPVLKQRYILDLHEHSNWYCAIKEDNIERVKYLLSQAEQYGQQYKELLLNGSFVGDHFQYHKSLRLDDVLQTSGFQCFQIGRFNIFLYSGFCVRIS